MRKFLCLLVALVLAGSIALAEAIDLSSMTDDDLLALKEQVAQAISDRDLIKEFKVTSGLYVVGSDIKAGRYKAIVPAEYGSMAIAIAKDIESANDRRNYLFYDHDYVTEDPKVYTFSLTEGNVLLINAMSEITLEKAEMIG